MEPEDGDSVRVFRLKSELSAAKSRERELLGVVHAQRDELQRLRALVNEMQLDDAMRQLLPIDNDSIGDGEVSLCHNCMRAAEVEAPLTVGFKRLRLES